MSYRLNQNDAGQNEVPYRYANMFVLSSFTFVSQVLRTRPRRLLQDGYW
jgi:hypothetical protein